MTTGGTWYPKSKLTREEAEALVERARASAVSDEAMFGLEELHARWNGSLPHLMYETEAALLALKDTLPYSGFVYGEAVGA